MQTSSYQPTHVAASHLETFYRVFDDIKDRYFDGMIITGAPLDYTDFEDVSYWDEVCQIGRKPTYTVPSICVGELLPVYIIIMELTGLTGRRSCPVYMNIVF